MKKKGIGANLTQASRLGHVSELQTALARILNEFDFVPRSGQLSLDGSADLQEVIVRGTVFTAVRGCVPRPFFLSGDVMAKDHRRSGLWHEAREK